MIGAAILTLNACDKNNDEVVSASGYDYLALTRAQTIVYCGNVTTVDFLAGQTIGAGSVTVGNDATNLYVTLRTVDGWEMQAIHLYVGDNIASVSNKQGNLVPGQFPIKETYGPRITEQVFVLPLSSLPECMTVAAHAEVVKVVDGVIMQSETAWGNGERTGKNWAMKFDYCRQECVFEDPDPDPEYRNETAWGQGPAYGGNWAMYVPYEAGATVNLIAGQHYTAGTITFSEVVEGMVTITITLAEDWFPEEGITEAVKIQGYDAAPSGNPAPGQFKTYKGNSLTVNVPAFAFYGIHVNVMTPVI